MEGNINTVEEVNRVVQGNTEFGGRLYNMLSGEPGNIILSPFCVSAVMAMASAGAGGDTLTQMNTGMCFPSTEQLAMGYREVIAALETDNSEFTLEVANTIFGQEELDILPAFRNTLLQHFIASIQKTDFSDNKVAAQMINNWVDKFTHEKIRDIIKPHMLNSLTKLVLLNAIYFKGDWAEKFDPELTENQDFYLADSSTVSVPMMTNTSNYYLANLENLDAAMIELPFKGERIVMQILLPKKTGGLRNLEGKLNEDLQTQFQEKKTEEEVDLFLPRFKLEKTIPLTSSLKQLGMTNMFQEGRADFSGIDGSKELFVSTVVQKAVIEVTEEGSEAAAATVVQMKPTMCMPREVEPPKEFRADHPFLLFLRDRQTGMTLFQGRVQDPTA